MEHQEKEKTKDSEPLRPEDMWWIIQSLTRPPEGNARDAEEWFFSRSLSRNRRRLEEKAKAVERRKSVFEGSRRRRTSASKQRFFPSERKLPRKKEPQKKTKNRSTSAQLAGVDKRERERKGRHEKDFDCSRESRKEREEGRAEEYRKKTDRRGVVEIQGGVSGREKKEKQKNRNELENRERSFTWEAKKKKRRQSTLMLLGGKGEGREKNDLTQLERRETEGRSTRGKQAS